MRDLLATYPDIDLVGEASDGNEALRCIQRLKPTVLLMDIHLRKVMDGIAATRLIRSLYPDVAIIGLSLDTREYIVYAMKYAGAVEVLKKDQASADDVYAAIQNAVTSKQQSDIESKRNQQDPD